MADRFEHGDATASRYGGIADRSGGKNSPTLINKGRMGGKALSEGSSSAAPSDRRRGPGKLGRRLDHGRAPDSQSQGGDVRSASDIIAEQERHSDDGTIAESRPAAEAARSGEGSSSARRFSRQRKFRSPASKASSREAPAAAGTESPSPATAKGISAGSSVSAAAAAKAGAFRVVSAAETAAGNDGDPDSGDSAASSAIGEVSSPIKRFAKKKARSAVSGLLPQAKGASQASGAAKDIAGVQEGRSAIRRINVRRVRKAAKAASAASAGAGAATGGGAAAGGAAAGTAAGGSASGVVAAVGSALSAAASSIAAAIAPILAPLLAIVLVGVLFVNLITSLFTATAAIEEEMNSAGGMLTGDAALLATFLMNDMGMTDVQAAAIIGNSVCETYDGQWAGGHAIQISFGTMEDGGEGIGFMQFTDAEEKQALYDMAAEMGKDWTDPDVQLRFFKEWSYPRQWGVDNATTWTDGKHDLVVSKAAFEAEGLDSAGTAALIFMGGYLRPAYSPSRNHYPNRMACAEAALRALRSPAAGGRAMLQKAAQIARDLTWVDQYVSGGTGPASLNWSGPKAGSGAWGGKGGFGCGMFVSYVYEQAGIGNFGGSVTDYYYHGPKNDFEVVAKSELMPGDLVVYGNGTHMAIWLGGGKVAESTSDGAAGGPGVRIIDDAYVFPDLEHHYLHYSKINASDLIAIAETQIGVAYSAPGYKGTCVPYDPEFINPGAAARPGRYANGTSNFNAAHTDCYGFCYYVWTKAGYDISPFGGTSASLTTYMSESQLVPGALIYYPSYGNITHWVMYAGNGQIIENVPGGVHKGPLNNRYSWRAMNPPS